MVITGYDGRNAQIVVDALQLKVLVTALDSLDDDQLACVYAELRKQGFKALAVDDIKAFIRQWVALLRPTTNSVQPHRAMKDSDLGDHQPKPKPETIQ